MNENYLKSKNEIYCVEMRANCFLMPLFCVNSKTEH